METSGASEPEGEGDFDPWAIDAASWKNLDYERLTASGGVDISAFCLTTAATQREARPRPAKTVLSGQRGLGKSFLLRLRSHNHRKLTNIERTFFYPEGKRSRDLVESLTSLSGAIPDKHPLRSNDAAEAWSALWQISIIGLLLWRLVDDHLQADGFRQVFGSVEQLTEEAAKVGDEHVQRQLPIAPLQWFLATAVLSHTASGQSLQDLNRLLFKATNTWALLVRKGLIANRYRMAALYIDNPDELVSPDEADLWASVQQGLLLAIWKLRKGGSLDEDLLVFASVRSEALIHKPHRDLQTASDSVLNLRYGTEALRDLFEHRIKLTRLDRLVSPRDVGQSPIKAFIGFTTFTHEDRRDSSGHLVTEDVVDAIVRHTRMVPRDVVMIGRQIRDNTPTDLRAVRSTVNSVGRGIVEYAKGNCFPAWSSPLDALLCEITAPVVKGREMRKLATQFDPTLVHLRTLLALGLLGSSVRNPRRHKHAHIQRFVFDVRPDETDTGADFYFVHPATKEWIKSHEDYSGRWSDKQVLIGHGHPYESDPPKVRVCVSNDLPTVVIQGHPVQPGSNGVNDPIKFLFIALLAWKRTGGKVKPTVSDLQMVRQRAVNAFPKLDLKFFAESGGRDSAHVLDTEHLRDMAKKLGAYDRVSKLRPVNRKEIRDARQTGVISIEGSDVGSVAPTLKFHGLNADEIDVDDTLEGTLRR